MNTPDKITAEEWLRQKVAYLQEQTYRGTDGVWYHRCGKPLQALHTRVSEHDSRFDRPGEMICAGMGETVKVEVPYCSACESRPVESGCIHR